MEGDLFSEIFVTTQQNATCQVQRAAQSSQPWKTQTTFPADRLSMMVINPLNAELNPICHLLALLGAHHILHVSRIRVNC
jgi:hypothetical protein